ncbi:hypothetical protein Patl1_13943 [Pistacia atlantica]|uniref:Uncharacterized protein n=1 Tax=Pistacia atlantica TaxID=434234 RepID=A0ACC1AWK8_9ROSI|nr:hypothetical protein Patl1_13943 [Pistacia atlantica]
MWNLGIVASILVVRAPTAELCTVASNHVYLSIATLVSLCIVDCNCSLCLRAPLDVPPSLFVHLSPYKSSLWSPWLCNLSVTVPLRSIKLLPRTCGFRLCCGGWRWFCGGFGCSWWIGGVLIYVRRLW